MSLLLYCSLLFSPVGVLLLALMLSCEGEMRPILEESSGNIMKSYIETPGSDCVVRPCSDHHPVWNVIGTDRICSP